MNNSQRLGRVLLLARGVATWIGIGETAKMPKWDSSRAVAGQSQEEPESRALCNGYHQKQQGLLERPTGTDYRHVSVALEVEGLA